MANAITEIRGFRLLSRQSRTEVTTYDASRLGASARVLVHVFPDGVERQGQVDLIAKLIRLMQNSNTQLRRIVLEVNFEHHPPYIVTEPVLRGATLRQWLETQLYAGGPGWLDVGSQANGVREGSSPGNRKYSLRSAKEFLTAFFRSPKADASISAAESGWTRLWGILRRELITKYTSRRSKSD